MQNQRAEDKAGILLKNGTCSWPTVGHKGTAVPKGLNCNGSCPARVFSNVW